MGLKLVYLIFECNLLAFFSALRERQAAERADMDPQKEAVESALSWNTEFNKTRRWVAFTLKYLIIVK